MSLRLKPKSIALVLSGGGARGAYEAGVLAHIAERHPQILERVRIISGSSVGAVNGAFLASRGLTTDSVHQLVELWQSLQIDDLLGLSGFDAFKMLGAAPLRLLRRSAPSPATGLLDGAGLWKLVTKRIDWTALHSYIEGGRFDAVCVSGTDLASGSTHVFTETHDPNVVLESSSEFTFYPVRLGRPHVLASAAIPLLFPPIRVRGRWYVDGGVRNNTPFAPALRLGADSLLLIDVHGTSSVTSPSPDFPGIGQVVGKLLDSIFLDRVSFDLDRLTRINDFVCAAEDIGQHEALTAAMAKRGRRTFRNVPYAVVKPTDDLGALAADLVRQASKRFSFLRVLDALFQDDANSSGDAASFLFFDGTFASALVEIGRRDAELADDRIASI